MKVSVLRPLYKLSHQSIVPRFQGEALEKTPTDRLIISRNKLLIDILKHYVPYHISLSDHLESVTKCLDQTLMEANKTWEDFERSYRYAEQKRQGLVDIENPTLNNTFFETLNTMLLKQTRGQSNWIPLWPDYPKTISRNMFQSLKPEVHEYISLSHFEATLHHQAPKTNFFTNLLQWVKLAPTGPVCEIKVSPNAQIYYEGSAYKAGKTLTLAPNQKIQIPYLKDHDKHQARYIDLTFQYDLNAKVGYFMMQAEGEALVPFTKG